MKSPYTSEFLLLLRRNTKVPVYSVIFDLKNELLYCVKTLPKKVKEEYLVWSFDFQIWTKLLRPVTTLSANLNH